MVANRPHLFEAEEQVPLARQCGEPIVIQLADGDVADLQLVGRQANEAVRVVRLDVDVLDDGIGQRRASEPLNGLGRGAGAVDIVAEPGAHGDIVG